MSKPSKALIEKMRLQIQTHDAEAEAAAKAEQAELIAPLEAITSSDEWTAFAAKLNDVFNHYRDDHFIQPHLNAILTAMRNLPLEVARRTQA